MTLTQIGSYHHQWQYKIHVRGIHHAGTGYNREIMHQSLDAFLPIQGTLWNQVHTIIPKKKDSIYKAYTFPTDKEKSNFLRVMPRKGNTGKLMPIADLCSLNPMEHFQNEAGNQIIGDIMFNHWPIY